jgi:hypothetical protein
VKCWPGDAPDATRAPRGRSGQLDPARTSVAGGGPPRLGGNATVTVIESSELLLTLQLLELCGCQAVSELAPQVAGTILSDARTRPVVPHRAMAAATMFGATGRPSR